MEKNSLKPWTWCQVNGYGYIKLYHILHGFPYAPMGRSRTQPHMPTPQGFPKKCPHLQLRALFRQKVHNWWRKTWGHIFEFSVVQKASKVFLVSEFPAIKTPKELLTQDQEACCFFFVSLWYIQKNLKPESPTWVCRPCPPITLDKAQIHLSNMVAEISKAPREEHGWTSRWSVEAGNFPQEWNIKLAGMFLKPSVWLKKTTCWLVGSGS